MKFKMIKHYYLPQEFSKKDYSSYDDELIQSKECNQKLVDYISEIQTTLKQSIPVLMQTLRSNDALNIPIFTGNARDDGAFPVKRLIKKLQPLAQIEHIVPQQIIELLTNCINELIHNRLDFTYEEYTLLRRQLSPIVDAANQAGKKLQSDLHFSFDELRRLDEKLTTLQQSSDQSKKLLMHLNPANVSRNYLNAALKIALTKIRDDASNHANSDNSACGIRGVCNDLLPLAAVSIETIKRTVSEYRTLQNLNKSSYATSQLELLEQLITVHQENLKLCSAEHFNENILNDMSGKIFINEKEQKSATGIPELNQLLLDYLDKRAAIKDRNKQTKEYFYGNFFKYFQKSYTKKYAAVVALQSALDGNPVDLLKHLSTLRNGNLGKKLRAFIKAGNANCLVQGVEVNTVSDFIKTLNAQVNGIGCKENSL